MDEVYYAETICGSTKKDGAKCNNKAYYITSSNGYACGVHSKEGFRTKLKVNPNKKAKVEENLAKMEQSYLEVQSLNQKKGAVGSIVCTKMKMRKGIDHVSGYLTVFPNKNHGNRSDGLE